MSLPPPPSRSPYLELSSEREIFELLGVRYLPPSERDGKFSLLHPETGAPWFQGGLPQMIPLQTLQLQVRPSRPISPDLLR